MRSLEKKNNFLKVTMVIKFKLIHLFSYVSLFQQFYYPYAHCFVTQIQMIP